jgi:SAM-dependent methyltransferase
VPIDDVAARGFEAGAAAYEAARPGYPDAVLELVRSSLSLGPDRRVCDLAAGTGKWTRRLLETGAHVVAVEPVEAMRSQLAAALGRSGGPALEILDGTAETIPLPDASVDLVTVAQAFHWFDAPAALSEIARVLRPGGGLALLWNERDERTAWVAEMSRIIRWHERTVSRYQHVDWAEVAATSGRFTEMVVDEVRWEQSMTREVLADRVRSISYVAVMPATERERLAAEATALVSRLTEPFPLPYTCRVWWAHLR